MLCTRDMCVKAHRW